MPQATVHWMLKRIADAPYDGGFGGTCWECPFASDPQRSNGQDAPYEEWRNDPTESWFTCSLPTRDPEAPKPEWGEYAPCTIKEWVAHLIDIVPDGPAAASGYVGRHRAEEANA